MVHEVKIEEGQAILTLGNGDLVGSVALKGYSSTEYDQIQSGKAVDAMFNVEDLQLSYDQLNLIKDEVDWESESAIVQSYLT